MCVTTFNVGDGRLIEQPLDPGSDPLGQGLAVYSRPSSNFYDLLAWILCTGIARSFGFSLILRRLFASSLDFILLLHLLLVI